VVPWVPVLINYSSSTTQAPRLRLRLSILSHVSLLYSLLIQLYGFVSFYTQLLLKLFIYWSSPLLLDKLLIIQHKNCMIASVTVTMTETETVTVTVLELTSLIDE
jgi:hypothetical protein